MGLLSDAQLNMAKAAIRSVTDTFYVDTVTYLANTEAFQRFAEDSPNKVTSKALNCRVTVVKNDGDPKGEAEELTSGAENLQAIEIRFNNAYLGEQSIDPSSFDIATDFFTWAGDKYKLRRVHHDDSDFAGDVQITVCVCRKEIKSS